MNNQKGEISLLISMAMWISFLLMILIGYKLESYHRQLASKLRLETCTKEVMGLSESYWVDMSKLNWGIDNATKAQMVAAVIPGLQGIALKVSKVKKALQRLQDARTVSYLIFLANLKRKDCSIPLSYFKTPFIYESFIFKRNLKGVALMRERSWNTKFSSGPYSLRVQYELPELKSLHPKWRKDITASKGISF